ncbi:tRNA-Thr(GGU) m(6)t(6)A37 methyltransferase TsaA [Tamilnaduibacter salinus]|uniref:tRNA-Thr(GGU) m(6)t(6)A37 methyltransferase TsaA n=1 Tax=Tamilnaduibacter salinus TaxID=1484056 RepID=A0A2U1CUR7_9GAMM|nr:tRNA (N6-threonylcarbamoyladenosine(37)-N6)-methyltransferase TrmO [Tamilnaduibacter salinus]PVY70790.1 tRNA-Thr(GGU) m(6)t(6)A37 methyltransferase TsaA [Tamilnaduibacter salinus]
MTGHSLTLEPIAITRSCFREKFAVPRQPGQTRHAHAELVIQPPYNREEAFRGLDDCSHLWLTFHFHEAGGWRPTVRPPRLGGNQKVGVFATRSPFRPNQLGLSVVRHHGLERRGKERVLLIQDHDLIDGTPIYDIKPYLPWADSHPQATMRWSGEAPQATHTVRFSAEAETRLAHLSPTSYPDFRQLIADLLTCDPRPGFRRGGNERRVYGVQLYDQDVRFRFDDDTVEVLDLIPVDQALA